MTIHQIERLLDGRTCRDDEHRILAAFHAADQPTLNALLERIDTAALFDGVDDRILGPDNRTALVELLVERGLTDGYYGIFTDRIGSTALVIDDFDGELGEVRTPTWSP